MNERGTVPAALGPKVQPETEKAARRAEGRLTPNCAQRRRAWPGGREGGKECSRHHEELGFPDPDVKCASGRRGGKDREDRGKPCMATKSN